MEFLERFIDKYLGPVATYMTNSDFFSALTEAFMKTTPVTLGVAFLLIVGNFPIPGWIEYLKSIGVYADFLAAQGATMNIMSLLVAFNFAYAYTKRQSDYNQQIAGIIAVASFLILMPQAFSIASFQTPIAGAFPENAVVTGVEELHAFSQTYLGGEGIIVALLVSFLSTKMYIYLNRKNIVVKLPSSVPANVSESLRPSILTGIIFATFLLIRISFRFVPFLSDYGNVFTFINSIIQAPLTGLVSNPAFLILALTIANVFWYFGIHPQLIYSLLMPMLYAISIANMTAFTQGQPLPYTSVVIIGLACGTGFGGQGGTIGLVISMIGAKSERYKSMYKLSVIPSIFNINEPLIFGMPIIMNPYFFFPMLFSPLLMGLSGYLMMNILNITINPMISLPWTTPAIFVAFARGGVQFLLVAIVALIVSVLVWYPFFKIADKKEYEQECLLAQKQETLDTVEQ